MEQRFFYINQTGHKCCLDCTDKCKKGKKCYDQCARTTYHNKVYNSSDDKEVDVERLRKIIIEGF